MKILLIRHASYHEVPPDQAEAPGITTALSPQGLRETDQLGAGLQTLGWIPTLYCTSFAPYAQKMGERLAGRLSGGGDVVAVSERVLPNHALTPHEDVEGFDALLDDLHWHGRDLRSDDVVALIGHEPRLSQLLVQLTSRRGRPLSRGEVIALSALSLAHFRIGRGTLEFRFPDRDDLEEGLAGKIGSKMTVSALLAGFTFTALLQVTQLGSSPLVSAATLALVAAFALFIASTYIYDRLAMPSGFWVDQDRAGRRDADAAAPIGGASPQALAYDRAVQSAARQPDENLIGWLLRRYVRSPLTSFRLSRLEFERDRVSSGPLYAYMLATWRFVFTPAVALAFLGFALFILHSTSALVAVAVVILAVAVTFYYVQARPKLGTD